MKIQIASDSDGPIPIHDRFRVDHYSEEQTEEIPGVVEILEK